MKNNKHENQKNIALNKINEIIEKDGYDYADNFRTALSTSEKEVQEYNKISANGCCGSYDNTIEINGNTWLIGFNYGH